MSARNSRAARNAIHVPELTACVVAMVSAVDTWFFQSLPPVFWAAALLAGALIVAALGGRRSGRRAAPAHREAPHGTMPHAAAGLLLVAVLQLASAASGVGQTPVHSGHAHSVLATPGTVAVVASIAAVGYAVLTVLVLPRWHGWAVRGPVIVMAAVATLMAGSIVT